MSLKKVLIIIGLICITFNVCNAQNLEDMELLCSYMDIDKKVDLNKLIKDQKVGSITNVKVVANLPYYITTPIIMKLLEDRLDIESITVMIQKEVAERLIAVPGSKETGAITYTIFYYCESKKIREVENTCFIPEPEVTSEVIKLNLRNI